VDSASPQWPRAAAHEAARSDNQRVQALEDYTTVTAPISGVVIWRYADTGALIQGGTNSNDQALPIVRLSQSSLLRLRFPCPKTTCNTFTKATSLQVRVDAINRSFTGKDRALHTRREL
jgi:multidrug efflux pump subunit AcrA (membrane-fusion protein)